jgi:hypothetical protein
MKLMHFEIIITFSPNHQLSGAGWTSAWQHHGSDTPTSSRAILIKTLDTFQLLILLYAHIFLY